MHIFFFIILSMPLSLIHSHLISESEAHLSQFTLSTPVIKLWSLNSLSQLPPNLDVIDPPAVPSHRSASDPHRHPPQTHAIDCLKPTSLSFFFSLSLSIFSSNQVPHYSTHLKSEHSISLWTQHHYLWSLIDDRRRSRQSVPNRTEYQAWVSVWLCWFFWVLVLFFFIGFDGHDGVVVV